MKRNKLEILRTVLRESKSSLELKESDESESDDGELWWERIKSFKKHFSLCAGS